MLARPKYDLSASGVADYAFMAREQILFFFFVAWLE